MASTAAWALVGGGGVVLQEGGCRRLFAELLAVGVDGVGDAVGEEDGEVAGVEVQGGFVVGGGRGRGREGNLQLRMVRTSTGVGRWSFRRGGDAIGAGDEHGLDGAGVGDTVRVRVRSSQRATSMVTYWESSLRSCSWSLSIGEEVGEGARRRGASERRRPETSAA